MRGHQAARLYERAGTPVSERNYWLLKRRITFFAGPLTYNAPHQHGAPVLLHGLHGSFGLRLGGAWQLCQAAMIPAGVVHELDIGGNPIAVLYLEGDRGDALTALLRGGREVDGAVIGISDTTLLRSLFEAGGEQPWIEDALADFIRHARGRSRRETDPRITQIAERLAGDDAVSSDLSKCARDVGLSPSRLQHLFTREMGVPFRRYRAWSRMRRAIVEITNGADFTRASHAAGFHDQAHFAHDFRRTFGAPASLSLRHLRR